METIIDGQTMFIKHTDAFCALLVDEYEREYKVPLWALNGVYPFNMKKDALAGKGGKR